MSFELDRKEIEYVFRGGPEWPVMVATLQWPSPDSIRGLYAHIFYQTKVVKGPDGKLGVVWADAESDFGTFFAEHLKKLRRLDRKKLSDPIQQWKEFFKTHRESRVPLRLILDTMLASDVKHQSLNGNFSLQAIQSGGIEIIDFEYRGPKKTKKATIDRNEPVSTSHLLSPETVEQEQQYRRAITVSIDGQGGKKEVYDSLGFTRLYAQRIQRISGATWKGKPCEPENKDDWVAHVPYHWITKVLIEDHRGAAAGNFTRTSGKPSKPGG